MIREEQYIPGQGKEKNNMNQRKDKERLSIMALKDDKRRTVYPLAR
jgi:hypothetical protein